MKSVRGPNSLTRIRPLSKIFFQNQNQHQQHSSPRKGLLLTQPQTHQRTSQLQVNYAVLKQKYDEVCTMLKLQEEQNKLKRTQFSNSLKKRYDEEIGKMKIWVHEILEQNKELQRTVDLLRFVISMHQTGHEKPIINEPPNIILSVFKKLVPSSQDEPPIYKKVESIKEIVPSDPPLTTTTPPKKIAITRRLGQNLDGVRSNIQKSSHAMIKTLRNIDRKQSTTDLPFHQEVNIDQLRVLVEQSSARVSELDLGNQSKQKKKQFIQSKTDALTLEDLIRSENLPDRRLSLIKVFEEKVKANNEIKLLKDALQKMEKANIQVENNKIFADSQSNSKKIKQTFAKGSFSRLIDASIKLKMQQTQTDLETLEYKIKLEQEFLDLAFTKIDKQIFEKMKYYLHLAERTSQVSMTLCIQLLEAFSIADNHLNILEEHQSKLQRKNSIQDIGLDGIKFFLLEKRQILQQKRSQMSNMTSRKGCTMCEQVREMGKEGLQQSIQNMTTTIQKIKRMSDEQQYSKDI